VATDFLTVEICTIKGLVTHCVLFFIDIASRAVKTAGISPHPDTRWMTQIARNLTIPSAIIRAWKTNFRSPDPSLPYPHHPVQRRQRLGGMLSYYHRAAA
jgi:hypothetical protein